MYEEISQGLRGDNNRFGRSLVECSGKVRDCRLFVSPQFLSAEFPAERVVRAVLDLAFRHEIAILEQFCSVFLQEPLDRASARFVRTNMDVADAFCHAISSRVVSSIESEGDHIC